MAERDAAIQLFAQSIPRLWPCTRQEAEKWVEAEFKHPHAIITGYFLDDTLIGISSLLPMPVIELGDSETEILTKHCIARGSSLERAWHWGGLSVVREHENKGVAGALCAYSISTARISKCEILLGHTGSERVLSWLQRKGFTHISCTQDIAYSDPDHTIPKSWVARIL